MTDRAFEDYAKGFAHKADCPLHTARTQAQSAPKLTEIERGSGMRQHGVPSDKVKKTRTVRH